MSITKSDDFFALYNEKIDYHNDGYFFTKLDDIAQATDGRLFKNAHKLKLLHLLVPNKPISGYDRSYFDYSATLKNYPEVTWKVEDAKIILECYYYKFAIFYQRGNKQRTRFNFVKVLYGFDLKLDIVTDVSPYLIDQIYVNPNGVIDKRKLFNWRKCFEDKKFKLEDRDKSYSYTGVMKLKDKLYPHLTLETNHYTWNAKEFFYNRINNMWVPPNDKTKKWITINFTEHLLSKKRFAEKRSPYHFDSDIEWFIDLLKDESFPALICKYDSSKKLSAEYIFVFKNDRLEINPGTFYITQTLAAVIGRMSQTIANNIINSYIIDSNKGNVITKHAKYDTKNSNTDIFDTPLTDGVIIAEFVITNKIIIPYNNKRKIIDFDNTLITDWSGTSSKQPPIMPPIERFNNINKKGSQGVFHSLNIRENKTEFLLKKKPSLNAYEIKLDENWIIWIKICLS